MVSEGHSSLKLNCLRSLIISIESKRNVDSKWVILSFWLLLTVFMSVAGQHGEEQRHVLSGARDIPHCWGDIVCPTLNISRAPEMVLGSTGRCNQPRLINSGILMGAFKIPSKLEQQRQWFSRPKNYFCFK